MTSILLLTEAIYCNIFRWNYLKMKNVFSISFAISEFLFDFEHFQKKYDTHSWSIFQLTDSDLFQKALPQSNMVNEPKHCWNLNESTFTIFIDHCEGSSVGKSLS